MRRLMILSIALLALSCQREAPKEHYPHLGLWCPCEVRKWESYSDGGSKGGFIRDWFGKELRISWDGRMRIDGEDDLLRPRLAYINAEHPSYDGALPLPLGSDAESELIAIFDEWISTKIPGDSLDRWFTVYFDYSIPVRDRLSKLPPLGDDQKRALSVAATSRYLKRQRQLGRAPSPEDG